MGSLRQTFVLVKQGTAALLLVATPLTLSFTHTAIAATPTTLGPSAQVSFTFDDGLQSASTQAAPTLAKYGLSGVEYIITNCVGMTTTPNTCRANKATPYMTWAQIKALQSTYGWEIGSHAVGHDCLASNGTIDPSDCQKLSLTTAQVDQ